MSDLLKLGKSYSVYTINGTYHGDKMKIVSNVTYDQLENFPLSTSVEALLNNDNFIPDAFNQDEYLKSITYYIGQGIDDVTKYYVVFDDIIDFSKTIMLDSKYLFTGDFIINGTMENPPTPEEVVQTLRDAIMAKYGDGIDFTIQINEESQPATTLERLEMAVAKSEEMLGILSADTAVITVSASYFKNDFKATMDATLETMKEINANTNEILAKQN